jgi:tetratricopeptide (TPR) repeat protein
MSRAAGTRAIVSVALLIAATVPARANRESEALRARASIDIYNLDRDEGIAGFKRAIAADPLDAAAYRGLATGFWLSITFRRGNMTVDDYLGRAVTRPSPNAEPPPAEVATAFREALDHALTLARTQLAQNPKSADAHYQLGAAVGLRASYAATVEGSAMTAFKAAREAYDEHEQVLSLDPRRKDAGLIVGTYRYLVSALSLPLRWMAYVVGFGGGKEKGLRMIEEAAAFGGENQDDARFALILLYNREKRYDDALKTLAALRERYPRNRLVWLETGATYLRAGRPADAERALNEGFARLAGDSRQRMFGEDALWFYKRGAARAALGRAADADADLRKALQLEGRKWVYGRTHLELGKLAMKAGKMAAARQEFQTAATLCDSDNDGGMADEARRLMNTAP